MPSTSRKEKQKRGQSSKPLVKRNGSSKMTFLAVEKTIFYDAPFELIVADPALYYFYTTNDLPFFGLSWTSFCIPIYHFSTVSFSV